MTSISLSSQMQNFENAENPIKYLQELQKKGTKLNARVTLLTPIVEYSSKENQNLDQGFLIKISLHVYLEYS